MVESVYEGLTREFGLGTREESESASILQSHQSHLIDLDAVRDSEILGRPRRAGPGRSWANEGALYGHHLYRTKGVLLMVVLVLNNPDTLSSKSTRSLFHLSQHKVLLNLAPQSTPLTPPTYFPSPNTFSHSLFKSAFTLKKPFLVPFPPGIPDLMKKANTPENSSHCVIVVPPGVTLDSTKLNEWTPVKTPCQGPRQRNSVGVFTCWRGGGG